MQVIEVEPIQDSGVTRLSLAPDAGGGPGRLSSCRAAMSLRTGAAISEQYQ